ncbi:MAG: enolase C-terminal domain-like protein [Elusimicrobiota bacterium]
MNPFAIRDAEVRLVRMRLKEPFVTALGCKEETVNAAVRIRLAGGAQGCGEASGSVVMARQTPQVLAAALRRLAARFRGRDVSASEPLAQDIWRAGGRVPAAAAAFECAAVEALCGALGVRLAAWFGGSGDRVETDLTLSAAAPEATAAAARRAADAGFRTLKIKVGRGGAAADRERVLAAHQSGRRPRIILDGNQKLSVDSALRLVEACRRAGARIALLEQPLGHADIKGLARLKARCPVPIAADESARSAADVLRLAEHDAVDVVNVKVAKTGLRESLAIIAIARAAGMKLMIGCMQESARGLAPSVHLACGTGAFDFVDLDSDALLAEPQPRGDFRRDGRFLIL